MGESKPSIADAFSEIVRRRRELFPEKPIETQAPAQKLIAGFVRRSQGNSWVHECCNCRSTDVAYNISNDTFLCRHCGATSH